MMAPVIQFKGDDLSVTFDRFDIESYRLFLRVKRLPEYKLVFNEEGETYTITAPARFASMLGVERPAADRGELPIADFLFDDQVHIVRTALEAKRFACWSDCGLGKTPIGLEFARHVHHRTDKRVLILTLNEIVPQWVSEAAKWYGDALPIVALQSRAQMKEWCRCGTVDGEPAPWLAVVNYEKLNHKSEADQVVSEFRYLGGIIPDESSRLKTGGGKQKWALIKSARGVEYKLSLTATPAPNEIMEFASQASFLEKMRTDQEIIWTFFRRDEKTHRWTVKKHARKAFFEFMAGWSIYIRDPRRYGWRANAPVVPDPVLIEHRLDMTDAQREILADVQHVDAEGNATLIPMQLTNTIQRNKLGQIAKGFIYRKPEPPLYIESNKPQFIADLIAQEVAAGHQVLVWTVFNEETSIIARALETKHAEIAAGVLTGSVPESKRGPILDDFRTGKSRVLISRAVMLGYGMNLQHCTSMIFSGFSDSYEQFYQALRRAYRYGQTKALRVHVPFIPALEGDTWENILRKQDQHEASIREMEANYIAAVAAVMKGAAA